MAQPGDELGFPQDLHGTLAVVEQVGYLLDGDLLACHLSYYFVCLLVCLLVYTFFSCNDLELLDCSLPALFLATILLILL